MHNYHIRFSNNNKLQLAMTCLGLTFVSCFCQGTWLFCHYFRYFVLILAWIMKFFKVSINRMSLAWIMVEPYIFNLAIFLHGCGCDTHRSKHVACVSYLPCLWKSLEEMITATLFLIWLLAFFKQANAVRPHKSIVLALIALFFHFSWFALFSLFHMEMWPVSVNQLVSFWWHVYPL